MTKTQLELGLAIQEEIEVLKQFILNCRQAYPTEWIQINGGNGTIAKTILKGDNESIKKVLDLIIKINEDKLESLNQRFEKL